MAGTRHQQQATAAAKPSRRSSKTSIVSIDPAVASHITASGKTTAYAAGHARTESTPARANKVHLTAAPRAHHTRTASAPQSKNRSNSLKRAKNSTDLLRLRSINAEKASRPTESTVKRGRNFTISNVGTGGVLHLSPTPLEQPFATAAVSPSPYPWMLPAATTTTNMASVPEPAATAQQRSQGRTRSVSPKGLLDRAAQPKRSKVVPRAHVRSQSFSTLDESRRSVAASLQPKAFRIVINRPESVHSSEEEDLAPTLQIHIPHYKLGTPRFSAHGTPFLRASSYSRASGLTSAECSSIPEQPGGGPPPASVKAFSKIQRALPADESHVPLPNPVPVLKQEENARSASAASYVSPITADLYDQLLDVYDDPSVVRYSTDKDIAAATKIRIIAQISSESFMDYDLVSDFFLTFRSYMTTFEVMDYLLARLRWAIGRLSDDGRIIRIRTFAALRHWILNYFDDDFVVNRRLRVRLCEEVNDLYAGVRQRPRGMAGASDLKILQDLKRCWNGRCALYWDAEEFNMDSNQEEPLLPGGVIGSRNPAFADISEATAALGIGLQDIPTTSSVPSSTPRTARKTYHKRLPSSEYAKKPVSIQSEQSIHATSCSLPRYHSRSPNGEDENPGRAPQPVSVLSRRQNAPSDLKVQTQAGPECRGEAHPHSAKRDSSRAETPMEALANSGQYADPHAGSMIRGFVYGPVEPFVQLPLQPPLSPSVRFSAGKHGNGSPRIPSNPQVPSHNAQNPAVKNIIGSIRRALSGKQSANEVTLITVSAPRPTTSDTSRRAPVPLNVAKSSDELRRKAAGSPVKTQLRIDLLCAAAVQSFQFAVPGAQDAIPGVRQQEGLLQPAPFSAPLGSSGDARQQRVQSRLPSHYTAQSGSILIVDDTAVAMPVMSGALRESFFLGKGDETSPETASNPFSYIQHASFDTQIAFKDDEAAEQATGFIDRAQIGLATSPGLGVTLEQPKSRTGSAVTVKRLAPSPELDENDAPSTGHSESLRSTSPPSMTEATSTSESPVSKAPAHGLRRRPGGDLRKNQNVHDLEVAMQHQSLDSMLDGSSHVGSALFTDKSMTTNSTPEQPRKKSQKVSMINTHSSQHLRPSFEAAVAGFSAIPDDDDGGLEATLLKLEGRYEEKSPSLGGASPSPTSRSLAASTDQPLSASTDPTDHEAIASRGYKHLRTPLKDVSFLHDEGMEQVEKETQPQMFAHRSAVFGLPTESPDGSDSEDSEMSLPILKRYTTIRQTDTTGDPRAQRATNDEGDDEARSSSDILEFKHGKEQELARPPTALTEGTRSFLLDEDENISDLSSEISFDIVNYSTAMGRPASPMLAAPGTAISGLEIPSHPLTHASLINLPAATPTLAGSPDFPTQPPTPQQPPLMALGSGFGQQGIAKAGNGPQALIQGPAHVPFILACDSQVLAQQFTIVEQSALTEIEWTDLVEMRWNNDKSSNTLDWAEYMAKHDDARGIDVVSARFNLVHKWVQSEIVLTQDIEERARVLSKFIHVAAHARRLHNYATMLQITIALSMTSITRLKNTWELVPGPDQSLLRHMENLAKPTRNFHDLRVEMESTDLTTGCVPFLGLYVHDLTYNANKPAEIRLEDGAEPLINFERFRTAAIIIKGLLRLIDASLRYDFEPIHGIIERCLWLSALTNDRIDALSKALE